MLGLISAINPGQWVIIGTILTGMIGLFVAVVKTRPANKHANNEEKQIDIDAGEQLRLEGVAARELLRIEYNALNKENRKDIHDIKEKLSVAEAELYHANKALADASIVQREDRADMDSMMFLIRILIDEVRRLDPDPNNKIIDQAEIVLSHMGRKKVPHAMSLPDPRKSKALNTAENTVDDAEATLSSAQATCKEVKRVEGQGK